MQFVRTEPRHAMAKIWFWCASESRCTTHNCNELSSAQACVSNKNSHPKLAEALTIVTECVNYVRNSALKHRTFKVLCNEMGSEFKVRLYYSNVRWLSRGKVLNRVFALRGKLAVFFREHQHCHADCFENSEFILVLAYIANIFGALNQQMQGGGVNIVEAEEHLKALQKKNRTMETTNRE